MTTPAVNTWTQNADGSLSFFGYVTFPAGANTASGAGIVIFGPFGGVANFPIAAEGPPGPSPTFTVTVVQVAAGTTLPSPNPATTFTPGAGDTPPNYDLTIYVNAGAAGESTSAILTATDLEGTPAAGYMIGYDADEEMAQWQAIPGGGYYFTNSVSATASNTTARKPLTSILCAALPYDWWPEVSGQNNVVGAVDTRVDLVARINSTTGDICGYGYGAAGAAPPPAALAPYGLYAGNNVIPAGSAATIFFNAENQTSSANPWNVTSSAFYSVKQVPVPA